jgi:hypothetical protein
VSKKDKKSYLSLVPCPNSISLLITGAVGLSAVSEVLAAAAASLPPARVRVSPKKQENPVVGASPSSGGFQTERGVSSNSTGPAKGLSCSLLLVEER